MEQPIQQLFTKYLEDRCSEEEILLLLAHFGTSSEGQKLEQLILEELSQQEILNTHITDIDQRLDSVYLNVKAHIISQGNIKMFRLWVRIAVAASVIFAIGTGMYLYQFRNFSHSNVVLSSGRDLSPGKNTAVLTLADGKTITLSDAKTGVMIRSNTNGPLLTYNDGSRVGGAAVAGPQKMLTVATPRGGTYQIVLPDGTKVWLNAASSIKFPSSFDKLTSRQVELVSGEAYFEVSKMSYKLKVPGDRSGRERIPFVVASRGQEVEVLGTHFNINTYTDEPAVKTTLLEGSVKVSNALAHNYDILKPGQQAALTPRQTSVQEVDINDVVAWKNGVFQFSDADIETIMRQISRWYDVEVVYENSRPKGIYKGQISRNVPISKVLDMLSYAGIRFKVEGKRITITE